MNDCARGVFDACIDVVDDCVTLCGGLAKLPAANCFVAEGFSQFCWQRPCS